MKAQILLHDHTRIGIRHRTEFEKIGQWSRGSIWKRTGSQSLKLKINYKRTTACQLVKRKWQLNSKSIEKSQINLEVCNQWKVFDLVVKTVIWKVLAFSSFLQRCFDYENENWAIRLQHEITSCIGKSIAISDRKWAANPKRKHQLTTRRCSQHSGRYLEKIIVWLPKFRAGKIPHRTFPDDHDWWSHIVLWRPCRTCLQEH